ncbi:metallophosphoesterase [Halopiger aswanensis]|uniref:Calcineurin-like phosphoesterase family protein n=1 Tax=Halopiger aswanensis TaxID=148449 RepID=A0A3R7KM14_9EURY|nr:metallophosphoesterase [Halopiger aswanensis]RKD97020.1 calcineurin-like phosphoesterase family protein [Halopiger aswanensis]
MDEDREHAATASDETGDDTRTGANADGAAGASTDDPVYYFISDLHIGGDEELEHVEFLDELLAFLQDLETTDENAELIINGDAFGLWEFTRVDGIEKFHALVDRYPQLFEQFEATGENTPITIIPGNHDYELAAYEAYVDLFSEYNVSLEQEEAITREVGDRSIWIEHGMQRDPNNRIPDFGNPHANPLGYYINRRVTAQAGRLSELGRYNWLKDIQAVAPLERIPEWLISKYFYREMHPLLRYAALPFLFLFNLSVLLLLVVLLDFAGIWSRPFAALEGLTARLGTVGSAVEIVAAVNLAVIALLVLISIPLYFVVTDIRRTLDRFGIVRTDEPDPGNPDEPYLEAAREVFDDHPETAVFIYGHTHRPSVTELQDRLVVNTGTWLKRLHRREPFLGLLPAVFYPSFRLTYVRITPAPEGVAVEYRDIEKSDPVREELTLPERLVTRSPTIETSIPERTIVRPDAPVATDLEADGQTAQTEPTATDD